MSCDSLFRPQKAPFPPKEEGADHVRLGFPLAGVARKTLHLKVAGIVIGKLVYLDTVITIY